jgi:NADP-dependent alcohol dehydrogenase
VISRSSLKEKRTMGGPLFFPKFAIMDPTFVATLPKRQLANGVIDAFTHTMEQYLTFPSDNLLQERYAEGILSTLLEIGQGVVENPADYKLASNLMWCANQALNGLLRCGVATDWATHMIGHELTALYEIDHARTLAIIGPNLYRVMFDTKKEKLAQYGQRVWNIQGNSTEEIAEKAIEKTVEFYQKMGMKTKLSENTDNFENTADFIVNRFEERGWKALGEKQNITLDKVRTIVAMSY